MPLPCTKKPHRRALRYMCALYPEQIQHADAPPPPAWRPSQQSPLTHRRRPPRLLTSAHLLLQRRHQRTGRIVGAERGARGGVQEGQQAVPKLVLHGGMWWWVGGSVLVGAARGGEGQARQRCRGGRPPPGKCSHLRGLERQGPQPVPQQLQRALLVELRILAEAVAQPAQGHRARAQAVAAAVAAAVGSGRWLEVARARHTARDALLDAATLSTNGVSKRKPEHASLQLLAPACDAAKNAEARLTGPRAHPRRVGWGRQSCGAAGRAGCPPAERRAGAGQAAGRERRRRADDREGERAGGRAGGRGGGWRRAHLGARQALDEVAHQGLPLADQLCGKAGQRFAQVAHVWRCGCACG